MSDTAQQSPFVLDENAFVNDFKSAMQDFCCELLWDCNVDGWALSDSELDMIRQALTEARADNHDVVSDVIANQFRIDAQTLRLINKGYCLHVSNTLWVANASDVLTVLSSKGIEALDFQDAINTGIAEWQEPLPKNPRYIRPYHQVLL